MPFNYKSPGIYVEEVDRGARPIESAATSVLGIIGLCRDKFPILALRDPNDPTKGYQEDWKSTPSDPRLITNWTEFTNTTGPTHLIDDVAISLWPLTEIASAPAANSSLVTARMSLSWII